MMLIPILFFTSKLLDLFITRVFLSHGMKESNILYNAYGEDFSFYLVYFLTFVIYIILEFFDIKQIKEVLLIYIFISFAISVFNLASIFV